MIVGLTSRAKGGTCGSWNMSGPHLQLREEALVILEVHVVELVN